MTDEARRRPSVVLDPAVRDLIRASAHPPYLDEIGPVDGRRALEEAQGRAPDDPRVDAQFLVAPVGPSGLVGFWLFRPVEVAETPGVVVYLHGGKWMLGDAHTHARLVTDLVLFTGAAVVVPEYTRTPEARYPVAIEEVYSLVVWLAEAGSGLGVDVSRLAVAGDCAGATMAAAVTMVAKRRSGPPIRAQLLFYPLLDPRCDSASQAEFGSGYLLTRTALRRYWQQYCDDPRQLAEPTAAPGRASVDDLAGLPPALVVTAEADVTRDEAEAYAVRLREAGVDAAAVRYLGTVHDFVSLAALRHSPVSRAAIRQGAAFLEEHLA
ncbi:alpha/beta hydrolase [Cryptosporangium aurantiacum]|uniref:Acetyl esterase/lipase n=1 Tax=Cryptosporangium aurantiacum TaxID=134849 RepID=A0A1M7RAN9_9ACTN|nr:alpha/beta hydrolase [Cryptosporangium aurantiacum]SHN43354.1 Acetyl esterase/lipase [Cryptosporangium aurantiacum]